MTEAAAQLHSQKRKKKKKEKSGIPSFLRVSSWYIARGDTPT